MLILSSAMFVASPLDPTSLKFYFTSFFSSSISSFTSKLLITTLVSEVKLDLTAYMMSLSSEIVSSLFVIGICLVALSEEMLEEVSLLFSKISNYFVSGEKDVLVFGYSSSTTSSTVSSLSLVEVF